MNVINKALIYTRYRDQSNPVWGSDTDFFDANMHLISNLRNLRICRKCFGLYGPIRLRDDQSVEQHCHCKPTTEERWHVTGHDFHYYHDFNCEYEICYCCGLEVIPSGSRWSSFYCLPCKNMIRELSQKAGQCIIPLGRHSIMNGIAISEADAQNRKAVSEFWVAMERMFGAIDLVNRYRGTILKKRVGQFKLAEYAPAIELVLRTNNIELAELKKEAFLGLLAFITNKP